jgi:hypothetical protein
MFGNHGSEAVENLADGLVEFFLAGVPAQNIGKYGLELFVEHLILHLWLSVTTARFAAGDGLRRRSDAVVAPGAQGGGRSLPGERQLAVMPWTTCRRTWRAGHGAQDMAQ